MDFAELRETNRARSENPRGFNLPLTAWSPAEWGCALAGEVGELCNLLKKLLRGDNPSIEDISCEIGDVAIYLDLLSSRLDLKLEDCIVLSFNRKSAVIGVSSQL